MIIPKLIPPLLVGLLMLLPTRSPGATVTENFTFMAIGEAVPDGSGSGLINLRSVASSIINITDISVSLHLAGGGVPGFTGINGDLYAYVQHDTGFSVLLNRPGMNAANPFGYLDPSGINVVFKDALDNGDIHTYPNPSMSGDMGPVTGTFQPDGRNIDALFNTPDDVFDTPRDALLSSFNGLDATGNWTLYVEDMFGDASNFTLESWALSITGEDSLATVPEPGTAIPLAIVVAIGLLRRRNRTTQN